MTIHDFAVEYLIRDENYISIDIFVIFHEGYSKIY